MNGTVTVTVTVTMTETVTVTVTVTVNGTDTFKVHKVAIETYFVVACRKSKLFLQTKVNLQPNLTKRK